VARRSLECAADGADDAAAKMTGGKLRVAACDGDRALLRDRREWRSIVAVAQ
jgi:hypothetical protein